MGRAKKKTKKTAVSKRDPLPAGNAPFTPPFIIREPNSKAMHEEKRLVLRVRATGNPAPSYQWLHNGAVMEGENSDHLVIKKLSHKNEGVYSCDLRNSVGAAYTQKAFVKIWEEIKLDPLLTVEELPGRGPRDAIVLFLLEGIPPEAFPYLRIRWYCDGVFFRETQDDFLEIPQLVMANGNYHAVIVGYDRRIKTNTIIWKTGQVPYSKTAPRKKPEAAPVNSLSNFLFEASPEAIGDEPTALPVESMVISSSTSPSNHEKKILFLEKLLSAWQSNTAERKAASPASSKKKQFLEKALAHFEARNSKKSKSQAA